jgi:hypothetical protein
MIRKLLLWGLTLVLIAGIVSLAIRGHRIEKEHAARMIEVVQSTKPTNMRVLNPQDLEIVSPPGGQPGRTPSGEIKIRNNGSTPYSQIVLKCTYLDHSGKELAAQTYTVDQSIMPGASIQTALPAKGIPSPPPKLRVTIVSADWEGKE